MNKAIILALLLPLAACVHAQVLMGGALTMDGGLHVQGNPNISITTSFLPNGTVSIPYSQTVQTANGKGTITFSLSQGGLPVGLSLDTSTGVISGTPTTTGSYSFVIRADASGPPSRFATQSYTVVISCTPLVINTSTLPGGVVGSAYSQTMQSSGGIAPIAWTVIGGALPFGLSLSSGGLISGIPSTVQTVSPSIQAQDSCYPVPQTVSQSFTIAISGSVIITTKSPLPQATEGNLYSITLAASGGNGPYTWSLASGLLPSGLSLTSAGVLSGTPTAAGTRSFGITVHDSGVNSTTSTFSLTVACSPLGITTSSLPTGLPGTPYSAQLTSSGGTGAVTWSSGNLPAGLSLSPSGVISGTPTQNGSFQVSFQATDSCAPTPQTTSTTLTLTILTPVTITTTSPLPNGIQGQPYSVQLSASGGSGSYTWSGSASPGLAISAAGVVSGTPTSSGTFTIVPQVTDSNGLTGTANLQLTITCTALSITSTGPLPTATTGTAYNFQFSSAGGVPPLVWNGLSLPPGLGISSSGLFGGIPTSAGMFNPSISVHDSCFPTVQTTAGFFPVTVVNQLAITTTSPLPAGTEGQSYSAQMSASGGAGSYTWTVTAGSLPAGLSLSSGGLISGTPTTTGTFVSTIRVQDGGALHTATGNFSITITCVPLSFTTGSSLQPGTQGVAYSQQLQSTGGNGTKTWTQVSGTLPNGVTLSSSGLLSGTPTNTGTFMPVIQLADSCSPTAQTLNRTFTLVINAAVSPLTIVSTSPLPNATEGQAYSFQMQASGGTPSYTWVVAAGVLPTGLSLSNGGAITGTPTTAGTFTATIRVTDNVSATKTGSFSIKVSCVPLTLNGATVVLTDNFAGPNLDTTKWAIDTGAAPGTIGGVNTGSFSAGNVSLSQGMLDLSVTQTGAAPVTSVGAEVRSLNLFGYGTYDYYARASSTATTPNGAGSAVSGQVTGLFNICNQPSNPSSCPTYTEIDNEVEGQFPTQLELTNWSSPTVNTTSNVTEAGMDTGFHHYVFVWSPGQVLFYFDGILVGTHTTNVPSAPAFVLFNHWGTNSTSFGGLATTGTTRHLYVQSLTVSTAVTALPTASQGSAYSSQLSSSGGSGAISWSLVGGTLPAGITLSSSGLLSGTPTTPGTSTFTIQVKDSCLPTNQAVANVFSIAVNGKPTIITGSPLPNAIELQPYSLQMSATGGQSPYSWSVISGALPAGLGISTGGIISGTPTIAVTSTPTIQVKDANGLTGSGPFSLTVICNPLTISTTSLVNGTQGSAYSQQLQSTGGTGAVTWALATGSVLPAGLSLSSLGVISGTPTVSGGPFSFTINATDSCAPTPQVVPQSYTLTIAPSVPQLRITTTSLPNGTQGVAYSANMAATGGVPAYTWTVVSGLPAGLALSGTGAITGQPTTVGTTTAVIRVTDSVGATTTGSFPITISCVALSIQTTSPLTPGTLNTAYSNQLLSQGGTGALTWSSSGGLPTGLSISAGGLISGTPSASGDFTPTIGLHDSCSTPQVISQQFALTIAPPLTIVTTSPLPAATPGQPYSVTITAAGGFPAYTWSNPGGGLPAGLSLNTSTGVISGTPTSTGYVQSNAATSSSASSLPVAFISNQASGNTNVIAVMWGDVTSTISSVTDTRGNTYSLAIGPTRGTGLSSAIYYAKNIASGSNTVTVAFNQVAAFPNVNVVEYNGLDTTSPLDVTSAAVGNGTTANSGSATTTSANEVIFGAGNPSTKFTAAGSGFTSRIINTFGGISEDRVVNATGSYNATATLTAGNWVMQMAGLKAVGGLGGSSFTIRVTDTHSQTFSRAFTMSQPAHTVTVAWTASATPGVTYNVKRSTVISGPFNPIQSGVVGLSFLDQNVQSGTTYYYVVSAQNGSTESQNSSPPATACIPSQPSCP